MPNDFFYTYPGVDRDFFKKLITLVVDDTNVFLV